MKKVPLLFAVLLALLLAVPILAQDSVAEQTISVQRFGDVSEIEETVTTLTRMDSGVSMQFNTVELESGDVITVWWVVSNVPQNCSDGVCGRNDIVTMGAVEEFVMPDEGEPCCSTFINHMPISTDCRDNCGSSNAPQNCSDGVCGKTDIVTMDATEEFVMPDEGEPCCSTFINHMPISTDCRDNCGSSNAPQNCSDGVCGKTDIVTMDAVEEFVMPDEGEPCCSTFINHMPISTDCRDNCGSSIMIEWGAFQGQLPVGDSSAAVFDRVTSMSAEIHFVIRVDGDAISVRLMP